MQEAGKPRAEGKGLRGNRQMSSLETSAVLAPSGLSPLQGPSPAVLGLDLFSSSFRFYFFSLLRSRSSCRMLASDRESVKQKDSVWFTSYLGNSPGGQGDWLLGDTGSPTCGEIECCSHGLAVNGKWKLFVLVVPGDGTQLVIQHPPYWHRHRHVV